MTAISSLALNRSKWQTLTVFALLFWLSGSLILDLVVMPGLYTAGMMSQEGFATAGYSIFWMFNRIELVCAALVVTGLLALQYGERMLVRSSRWAIALSVFLLSIALIYTYALTPEMSALGIRLDLFAPTLDVPSAMNRMHQSYWMLEVVKLAAAGALLNFTYKAEQSA